MNNSQRTDDPSKPVGSNLNRENSPLTRRDFLHKSAAAGAVLTLGSLGLSPARALASSRRSSSKPNILFVIVDQLRQPQWFPDSSVLDSLLPNLATLRNRSVSFDGHYTAATACTPARGCLLTGLYTHQHALFNTRLLRNEPELHTGFLTWGTALRDHGYQTNWYGKWHISDESSLEGYGFDGGTYPSPNGGVQQGTRQDPQITDQFLQWFEENGDKGPWQTTVSFVNPHDISHDPRGSKDYFAKNPAKSIIASLPANFETPDDLKAHKKPALNQFYQAVHDFGSGPIPYSGDGFEQAWLTYLDEYIAYQQLVDAEIGRVVAALNKRPDIAENTVIIFTSDHGELGGSHGTRDKVGGGYEEAFHVPLYIYDPTGRLNRQTNSPRTQLTSSVDIFPLLLTIGSGGNAWRGEERYSHLADRADIASILHNPAAAGRSYVIHTTDEGGSPEHIQPALYNAYKPILDQWPNVAYHALHYRSADVKYGEYTHWQVGGNAILPDGAETELYDYSTSDGRLELINQAEDTPDLAAKLHDELVNNILPNEVRKPLPKQFETAQYEAYQTWEALQA